MSRKANLSPLGLFSWDNTLFDLMEIPSALNRETLVYNLLAETAELEVLYANAVVMKNLIAVWSRKNLPVWQKLYETTQYEYNPIENYNRVETGTNNGSGSTAHTGSDSTSDRTTYGGTDTRNETITHGGEDKTTEADTQGHWKAGFDAGTPTAQDDGLFKESRDQNDATNTLKYGKTETVAESRNYGQTIQKSGTISHGETIVTTEDGNHTLQARGNIGVTTTQEMIQQERNIDRFNIYDIIIEDFKMRFCILVY